MPNIHFTDDGESQKCTTDPCPPHPADSRPPLDTDGEWGPAWHGGRLHETARFTPLDSIGRPAGPARYVPLESPVEVTYTDDEYARWEAASAATREQLRAFGESMAEVSIQFQAIGTTMAKVGRSLSADIWEVFTGRPWRPSKRQRREAKRRKLAQRRAARALPHVPGRVWHVDFHLYDWSIAEEARGRKTRPHPRTRHVHIGERHT